MDEFRIDSHKLMYHVGRVGAWQSGERIFPIYVEVSPTGACNHRCTFCALDYTGYRGQSLDAALLAQRLGEMGRLGVKSVMFAGEGEPLLHKDIAAMINGAKAAGLDVAVTTNGVLLDGRFIEGSLAALTWIKVSVNAAAGETYSRVHGTDAGDLKRVMDNVAAAVRERDGAGLKTAIGIQLVLLPENVDEVIPLAVMAKDAGADYLVVKPYSQHPKSAARCCENFRYGNYLYLDDELRKLADDRFRPVFRRNAMKKLSDGKKGYDRCLALPFWAYIDSGGRVWACGAYIGDEKFLLGAINEDLFERIWNNEKARKLFESAGGGLDVNTCRKNCRMDEVNRYLHELTHPGPHVNFI